MAIERVESAFNGSQRQLDAVGNDLYTGSHEAPEKPENITCGYLLMMMAAMLQHRIRRWA